MDAIQEYSKSVQAELRQLVRDLCAIPAPSHHEEKRAEFCRRWFVANGFENVTVDDALNVLAPVRVPPSGPAMVVMAHTDTVFPDMEPMPFSEKEGGVWACPGITDDTANLAVLMVCARYFLVHAPAETGGILFVANSCEEGLGNLKGCRKLMETYGATIRAFVSLDCATMDSMVTKAVGSHRYRVAVRTEGGHSFSNFGNRNAIQALSSIVSRLYEIQVPVEGDSRTTYNVGLISGGTSVNTIAQNAEMMCEYRSDSRSCLETMRRTFDGIIGEARASGLDVTAEKVGDRPCGGELDAARQAALEARVCAAMKAALGVEEVARRSGSTDSNVPLSMGIPSVCFGVCRGGGAHTREEWLDVASLQDGCRLLLRFLMG